MSTPRQPATAPVAPHQITMKVIGYNDKGEPETITLEESRRRAVQAEKNREEDAFRHPSEDPECKKLRVGGMEVGGGVPGWGPAIAQVAEHGLKSRSISTPTILTPIVVGETVKPLNTRSVEISLLDFKHCY